MRLRLRQIAVAVTDLAAARADAEAIFGVGHAHEDPGVARYGLRNAVYRLGNTFLELLTPIADSTTVGRLLAKQGSDCGYMVILQTDKIDEARARIMEAGVRVVDQLDRSGAGFTHLHPRDVGGTLLSIDYMEQWERWEWGGPDWGIHPAPDCSIVAAEMHGAEPEVMAKRWSTVLDRPCSDGGHGWHIALYEGELRFVRKFGVEIPERKLQSADGRCAVAVTTGLLVSHGHLEHARRIELHPGLREQFFRPRIHQPRDEALAQEAALRETANGIERKTGHRLAVADHVAHDGDQRHRVFRKTYQRVRDVALERDADFADSGDAHEHSGG